MEFTKPQQYLKAVASQAPLVFVVLSLALLWLTDSLHIGAAPESVQAGMAEVALGHGGESDDHDHGSEADAHEDEHGPDDASCSSPEAPQEADWCAEHAVAESACTRCNPGLIAAFKARGDWCAGHRVPESQCQICNPTLAIPDTGAHGDLARLETLTCEHDVRTIDCDDCRFEVGVVKLDAELASTLLKKGRVELREDEGVLRLTGEVALARSRVVDVSATTGGRILEVRADLGDIVDEGDLLAVIHSGEFGEAKAGYLRAQTNLEVTRQEQERQASVTEAVGMLIRRLAERDEAVGEKAADAPIELPDMPVGEWKSKLVGAGAKLRLARLNHRRELSLEKKGISSGADRDAALEALEAAEAGYAALLEEVKLSIHIEKLRTDNALRQAKATVTVSELRLRVLGLDDEGLDQLRKREPASDFARLEIRAPRVGTVTTLDLAPGRFVEAGDSLFVIADLTSLWVWCDLYERDLEKVAAPLAEGWLVQARVRVASFPGRTFEGVLDLLGSRVDSRTRTIKTRIQVKNPDAKLRPGMFVDVAVVTSSEGQVRVVPRSAVLTDDGRAFVFQHWRDDFWVRRDVEVREAEGDLVAIEGELPVGSTVAIGGAFMLKSDVLRDKMGAG